MPTNPCLKESFSVRVSFHVTYSCQLSVFSEDISHNHNVFFGMQPPDFQGPKKIYVNPNIRLSHFWQRVKRWRNWFSSLKFLTYWTFMKKVLNVSRQAWPPVSELHSINFPLLATVTSKGWRMSSDHDDVPCASLCLDTKQLGNQYPHACIDCTKQALCPESNCWPPLSLSHYNQGSPSETHWTLHKENDQFPMLHSQKVHQQPVINPEIIFQ